MVFTGVSYHVELMRNKLKQLFSAVLDYQIVSGLTVDG